MGNKRHRVVLLTTSGVFWLHSSSSTLDDIKAWEGPTNHVPLPTELIGWYVGRLTVIPVAKRPLYMHSR